MEALELSICFGVPPCQKGGHTLRTKAGHCIQCDTAKIAYQFRHSAAGHVYLAFSSVAKLAKVGFTKGSPQDRVDFLCRERYGNATDWELHKAARFEKDAGRKEFAVHSLLESHLKLVTYEKYKGQMVECREVFSCDLAVALKAFDQVTATRK